KQAHDRVSNLEAEIRDENPEIASILTHIESEPATIEAGTGVERNAQLEAKLKTVAAEFTEILDTHDIEVKHVRGRVYVSCHCTFADELPLARVHDLSTALESRFKKKCRNYFASSFIPSQSLIIGGEGWFRSAPSGLSCLNLRAKEAAAFPC